MNQINHTKNEQEGHDGPVSLHWLILEDPEEELKLVAMSSNKKISKYFTKYTHVKLIILGNKFGLRVIIYTSY